MKEQSLNMICVSTRSWKTLTIKAPKPTVFTLTYSHLHFRVQNQPHESRFYCMQEKRLEANVSCNKWKFNHIFWAQNIIQNMPEFESLVKLLRLWHILSICICFDKNFWLRAEQIWVPKCQCHMSPQEDIVKLIHQCVFWRIYKTNNLITKPPKMTS